MDAACYNAVIQEQSIGIHYNVGKSVLGLRGLPGEILHLRTALSACPETGALGVEVNKGGWWRKKTARPITGKILYGDVRTVPFTEW